MLRYLSEVVFVLEMCRCKSDSLDGLVVLLTQLVVRRLRVGLEHALSLLYGHPGIRTADVMQI